MKALRRRPVPRSDDLRLEIERVMLALMEFDDLNIGVTIRTNVPGVVELIAAVRALTERRDALIREGVY